MSQVHYQYQAGGTHRIRVENLLEEETVAEVVNIIEEIYQHNQATFISIDLRDTYALPVRIFATELKRCYREQPESDALYLAIIVELSVVQVMKTMLKTLVRRDPIQLFTNEVSANQWLMLERSKQISTQER